MTGLNKFDAKQKRRERLRNHIAKDLATPKYHQRVIERKRYENEDGQSVYFDYAEEDEN